MECKKCKTIINNPGVSFCPNCGAYLRKDTQPNSIISDNNKKEDEMFSNNDAEYPPLNNLMSKKEEPIDDGELTNNNSDNDFIVVAKDIKSKSINLFVALILLACWIAAAYFIINKNSNDFFFVGLDEQKVSSDNNNQENETGNNGNDTNVGTGNETDPGVTTPETPTNPTTPTTPPAATTPTTPPAATTPATPPTPTTPTTPATPSTPTTPSNPGLEKYSSLKGVSKSGYNGVVTEKYQTSIVHDNQYFKQIELSNKQEVLDLIKYDSNKQKSKCSSNILAIENNIISNYGITAVNLCEMDTDFAIELEKVVAYIYNNFPNARNHMTNMTLPNLTNGNCIVSFMPIFTFITSRNTTNYPVGIKAQILLNTKYFLNPSKVANSASYGASTGYFPRNAVRSSTVAHEFGHYLSYVALLKHYGVGDMTFVPSSKINQMYAVYNDFNDGVFSKQMIQEAYNVFCVDTGSEMGFDNFRGSISAYAIAKDGTGKYIYDETIAEAFHDVYLNGNNAKAASKYVFNVLLSKLS